MHVPLVQPKEEVDLTTVDFDKMRVKELKQTLQAWSADKQAQHAALSGGQHVESCC